jgi:hypothetical protein
VHTPTDWRYSHARTDSRTYARVSQATELDGTAHVNDRSWLYAYDRLSRLTGAVMGQLSPDNQQIAYGDGIPAPGRTTWDLDNLGNWSGGDSGQGSVVTSVDSDGDGQYEVTRRLHHEVNQANVNP